MMSCRDVAAVAHDHVDGGLPFRKRLGLRLHLIMCAHCRRAIRQLRATVALLRRVAQDAPPPANEAALVAEFRRQRDRGGT